jgi:branched-chain amino acid transport system permease protein
MTDKALKQAVLKEIPAPAPTYSVFANRTRHLDLLLAMLVVVAAVGPIMLGGRYILHVATMVAIMAILALSMNLMLRIGQISMAHGAFMAMGAYASGLLTSRADLSPCVAMLIGAAATGIVASLLGLVILRIRGVFFVLLTYAFGQIINLTLQEWTNFTGGNNGLHGIPRFSFFDHALSSPWSFYLLSLGFATIAYLLVRAIFSSAAGEVLSSIDQDEPFSCALGVNALMWRTAVFGISAAMAAVAGSLYAHHLQFLSPSTFGFLLSVDLLVINIVGGMQFAIGPLIGAMIVVPLPELLRAAKEYELLAYGALLLACLLFFKTGVAGWLSHFMEGHGHGKN